jgi:hypothetical protein
MVSNRPDLAGLAWKKGDECLLPKQNADRLQMVSQSVRNAWDASLFPPLISPNGRARTVERPKPEFHDVGQFWSALHHKTKGKGVEPAAIPTLQQMLTVENPLFRQSFVEHLQALNDPAASVALANRAVFELDSAIRLKAIDALRNRPAKEYLPVLLQSLQHAWAPAAQHASEALVALELYESIPVLLNIMTKQDPGTPYRAEFQGNKTLVVQELVRVNHLRNCMLCHAPSSSKQSGNPLAFVAPQPIPGQALPPSSFDYCGFPPGPTIRPDIVYLKQDFSAMQRVANPGAWPELQRFDYLVRVRKLTQEEGAAWRQKEKNGFVNQLSEHKQAILYALHELTSR